MLPACIPVVCCMCGALAPELLPLVRGCWCKEDTGPGGIEAEILARRTSLRYCTLIECECIRVVFVYALSLRTQQHPSLCYLSQEDGRASLTLLSNIEP